MRSLNDSELEDYRLEIGSKEYTREYNLIQMRTVYKMKQDIRDSGLKYKNSDDKIKDIKEKYKNGVTKDILKEWLSV